MEEPLKFEDLPEIEQLRFTVRGLKRDLAKAQVELGKEKAYVQELEAEIREYKKLEIKYKKLEEVNANLIKKNKVQSQTIMDLTYKVNHPNE